MQVKVDYSQHSLGDIVAELGENEECASVLEQELQRRYPPLVDLLPGLYRELREESMREIDIYIKKLLDSEQTFDEIVTF